MYMNNQQIIDWLIEGDVSIQYQVCRDLLESDKKNLQAPANAKLPNPKPNARWRDVSTS